MTDVIAGDRDEEVWLDASGAPTLVGSLALAAGKYSITGKTVVGPPGGHPLDRPVMCELRARDGGLKPRKGPGTPVLPRRNPVDDVDRSWGITDEQHGFVTIP